MSDARTQTIIEHSMCLIAPGLIGQDRKTTRVVGWGFSYIVISITTINHWQGTNSPHAKLTGIVRMQTGLRMEYVNLHSYEISVLDY